MDRGEPTVIANAEGSRTTPSIVAFNDVGEKLVGHKIGLTSRAMQRAMNITTPDSGFLTDHMVFAPDTDLTAADFLDLKVEVELAFVLAHDVAGPDLTVDDILDAHHHRPAA